MTAVVFSIATPTRNALPKLRRCIGSVRGQTGVGFEHLVQDAVSTDGSPDWLQAHAARDVRLQPRSEADAGMYDAINRAWSRSSGQILSWLNADEQLLPGALTAVQQHFDRHPEVDAVFADYLVVDGEGRAVAARREIPLRRFYVTNTFLYAQSCTLFYRRHLWESGLLRLDDRLRYAADKDLVLRLLAHGVRFAHLPRTLALFGIDGSNLSTHAGMLQEAEAVRLAHGGFRWRPARALAYAGRRLERLWCGAYRRSSVEYPYAIDENPTYSVFRASRLGGRYSLADTTGQGFEVQAAAAPTAADKQNP